MIGFTCLYCGHGLRGTRERVDAWFRAHYDPHDYARRCQGRIYRKGDW